MKMSKDLEILIEELCSPSEMDHLYEVALFKTRRLDIFKGEAFSFYIGVLKFVEMYLEFDSKFERFNILLNEEYSRRDAENCSFEEYSKFENKWISTLSRLEKEKNYLNLTILFQYSLIIESAINRDQVMKDHPERKDQYLGLGLFHKNTDSTWIELVSYAANFSRHYSEWGISLREVFKQKDQINVNLQNLISDKNKRKSITKLLEIPTVQKHFASDALTWEISDSLIKELELFNIEKSFKRIELWLLRLEIKWADQFFPNQDKYLSSIKE